MIRLAPLVVVALLLPGCLSALQGMDVVVRNETDARVEGTLRLKRPAGDVVHEATFALEPGEHVVVERATREAGRFLLNVTLADGRSAETDVRGGGTWQHPQVTIRAHEILVAQRESEKAPSGV